VRPLQARRADSASCSAALTGERASEGGQPSRASREMSVAAAAAKLGRAIAFGARWQPAISCPSDLLMGERQMMNWLEFASNPGPWVWLGAGRGHLYANGAILLQAASSPPTSNGDRNTNWRRPRAPPGGWAAAAADGMGWDGMGAQLAPLRRQPGERKSPAPPRRLNRRGFSRGQLAFGVHGRGLGFGRGLMIISSIIMIDDASLSVPRL